MTNYLKEMIDISGIEVPELLPKYWVPKHEYVEISCGTGIGYVERIVRKHEVKAMIDAGWQITRLSKVSKSMMYSKWKNAIVAME